MKPKPTGELLAPAFKLPSANPPGWLSSSDFSNRNHVLLFLPCNPTPIFSDQLQKYQERLTDFALLDADLLAIIPSPIETLTPLGKKWQLDYPLLGDTKAELTHAYSLLDEDIQNPPFAVLIGNTGYIHRIYTARQYPHFPNPALLIRALRNLNAAPKLAPITPEDWTLGPVDAVVTLVEYSDYQCKSCKSLHDVIHSLLAGYPGKIRLVHRHLPLRHTHELAQIAAEAAEAAGSQGMFWEMHDRLFQADGDLNFEKLEAYAEELGLNVQKLTNDLKNHHFENAVDDDFKTAILCQIKLPPTLFINGSLYQGYVSLEKLSDVINGFL